MLMHWKVVQCDSNRHVQLEQALLSGENGYQTDAFSEDKQIINRIWVKSVFNKQRVLFVLKTW